MRTRLIAACILVALSLTGCTPTLSKAQYARVAACYEQNGTRQSETAPCRTMKAQYQIRYATGDDKP